MAKTAMIVTTCVVSIVILFAIFSYLLSIVNPGLMVTNATNYRRIDEMQDLEDDKTDILYPNEELSAKDNVHFGLEKLPEDYEIFPYETETKGNAEIGKRFVQQKPARISAVTIKSTIKVGDHILTTDGKKPVTLIVYPLKDSRRLAREKKNKQIDRNPKNVLLKIIDDSGQAKLEVIADSARLIYKQHVNGTKKESGTGSKVLEIRPNNTLVYNVKEKSFKIVKSAKILHYNSTPRQKIIEQVVENTDVIDSTTINVTTEQYFSTNTLVSNNLSVPTELITENDLSTATVMRKK